MQEEQTSSHIANLSKILDLVEQINAVDTNEISPMAHPLDNIQRMREDEVTEENKREQLQQNAPKTAAGLYLVPKVIEECETDE